MTGIVPVTFGKTVVYIGIVDTGNGIRCHLCNSAGDHLGGYYLFHISKHGYTSDTGIGGKSWIDRCIDLDRHGKSLKVTGVDEII